ncbi:MAG: GGDEF domain-containing protein [Deltaproteobacteria bacterium]|nr:GGDEF domain-containing protein [Deltaproteobacteria bacterium]
MSKRVDHRRSTETIRFNAEEVVDCARTARRFASLLVVQGAEVDLGTHVVCDRPVTMGRDVDVELPLRDGSISRRHCRVELDDETGRYLLRDLGSTNGTRVNGTRVREAVPLAEGDKIFLGTSVVKFSYADGFDVDYHARLESLVTTDALTGLLAKRRFDAEFSLEVQRSRDSKAPLAVLVMDIDGLKQINDTHGHEMGGFAITEVAHIIGSVMEGHGETCRFGGDEFISFLPGKDKGSALKLAEQIRDRVAQHLFEKGGVRVHPTISIGVASLPEDGEMTDELFRAADRALYRAKGAGKNQVVPA